MHGSYVKALFWHIRFPCKVCLWQEDIGTRNGKFQSYVNLLSFLCEACEVWIGSAWPFSVAIKNFIILNEMRFVGSTSHKKVIFSNLCQPHLSLKPCPSLLKVLLEESKMNINFVKSTKFSFWTNINIILKHWTVFILVFCWLFCLFIYFASFLLLFYKKLSFLVSSEILLNFRKVS